MINTNRYCTHVVRDSRAQIFRAYLAEVAMAGRKSRLENLYLWPRTPLEKIQEQIRRRIGASDTDHHLSYSRPGMLAAVLRELRLAGLVPAEFSLLDVACGDAIVITALKEQFTDASIFGLDCNAGRISSHDRACEVGVELFPGYIQDLFRMKSPVSWDVVMMLNTYRGWHSADLREHERELPKLADAWFLRNARYLILTITGDQVLHFRKLGFQVALLGKGEDDSLAVLMTKEVLPQWPRYLFAKNWIAAKLATAYFKYR